MNDAPVLDTDGQIKLTEQQVELFQGEAFFHLGMRKSSRLGHVLRRFKTDNISKVWLAPSLSELSGNHLQKDWGENPRALDDCFVIVTNNDISKMGSDVYQALYEECPNTFFIGWDWDNHHWMIASILTSVFSDLYVPCHPENLGILSRYNSAITEPVNTGVVQWSRNFIQRQNIIKHDRSNEPLGLHTGHTAFTHRIKVLGTLNKVYPTIGTPESGYHNRSAQERWDEWANHKVHWIVPTMNDIPCRMFDALVTGGIPLVPESLRFQTWEFRRDVLYYDFKDIIEPGHIVAQAVAQFDKEGSAGIMRRHSLATRFHHGDNRVRTMLGYAMRLINA